jgi:hypothetical protein
MKTTLELPDELARRVRMQAVKSNQKLKDAVAELLEIGLANVPVHDQAGDPPKPVRLKGGRRITIDEIEAGIASGRD